MGLILVSDVFGKTPALVRLADALNAQAIVDPYAGRDMGFGNEAQAYSYFMKHVGLDAYLAELKKVTESTASTNVLVGFSIGASVIWRLSGIVSAESVDSVQRAVCFYGSQIRNFSEVKPRFAVELVFPKSEPHFDVLQLQQRLSGVKNVTTSKVGCLHGFMNACSKHYNQAAYIEPLERLRLDIG